MSDADRTYASLQDNFFSGRAAGLILAVINLVEKAHPSWDGEGNVVEVSAIDEGSRSGMYTLAGSVFPQSASVEIILTVGVGGTNITGVKAKLSGDSLRPVGDKVVLARALHRQDRGQLVEAKVAIVVAEALCGVGVAKVHEVWHKSADLIGVSVVWQGERGIVDVDLVSDGSIKPFMLEKFVDDRVFTLACTA